MFAPACVTHPNPNPQNTTKRPIHPGAPCPPIIKNSWQPCLAHPQRLPNMSFVKHAVGRGTQHASTGLEESSMVCRLSARESANWHPKNIDKRTNPPGTKPPGVPGWPVSAPVPCPASRHSRVVCTPTQDSRHCGGRGLTAQWGAHVRLPAHSVKGGGKKKTINRNI